MDDSNTDGVEEYESLVENTSEWATIALYKFRQYVFNALLRKYHTEETLEEDPFIHGQIADGVNDASFYWLPLENMILGLFTQPKSHYDSDTT